MRWTPLYRWTRPRWLVISKLPITRNTCLVLDLGLDTLHRILVPDLIGAWSRGQTYSPQAAWRKHQTLLIGSFTLCFTFSFLYVRATVLYRILASNFSIVLLISTWSVTGQNSGPNNHTAPTRRKSDGQFKSTSVQPSSNCFLSPILIHVLNRVVGRKGDAPGLDKHVDITTEVHPQGA